MSRTKIEWTDTTWNPITGCTRISEGCRHCYALRMAERLKAMGQEKYRNGGQVTLHPDVFREPYRWRKPRMVFVNSMSDTFHEDVSPAAVARIFDVMEDCPRHTFQVLTKRSTQMAGFCIGRHVPDNVWLGVTVENRDAMGRIYDLQRTVATTRFLSCEPLLESLGTLDLRGISWVIVGGESGPGARPMKAEWVREIRDQCNAAEVTFFFKQWGGVNKKKTGRLLDGRTWDEMPRVWHLEEREVVE